MKLVKKIFALLIAMVMVLGMSTSVFAATYDQDDTNGKITISNATIDTTYTLYKVFDQTIGEGGSPTAYSVISGKTVAAGSYYGFTIDAKGNVTAAPENVTGIAGNADAVTWFKSIGSTQDSWAIKATAQTVEWSNLTPGYYLVVSDAKADALVTITREFPTASIIDKNLIPSFEDDAKEIVKIDTDPTEGENANLESAQYGSTISYKVTANATNYDGEKKIVNYRISDTKADGLTYVKDSVKVYVDAQGTTAMTNQLATTAYKLTWGEDDKSFTVEIPWYADEAFLYNAISTITVTYDATVNTGAILAGTGNQNTAKFSYQKEGEPWTEEETSTETVYTFALAILKTDEKGNPLKNAEFTIASADGTALKVAATETAGVYNFDSTSSNTTVKSPESGVIVVKGVKAGTYTVTETVAPDGYNLLTTTTNVEAKVAEATTYTTKITTYYDAEGNVVDKQTEGGTSKETDAGYNVSAITVVNDQGTTLPSTGGIGTTIFYIIGAILVIGAGVVLVTRRRMNAQ